MLKRIKAVLANISLSSNPSTKKDDGDRLMSSVAILLVEVMHADHHMDKREMSMVIKLLQQQFNIDESEARSVFSKASQKMKDVVSLHQHASLINASLSYQEKQIFMTNLWRVVFADGQVDKYEEHLARRIADLVYLSHKDFIKAKHTAQDKPEC